MAQRSSWGSNSPARRKGYRVLRYWADTHDGTGYRRHCETFRGSKRDGDRRLAEIRVLHADDRPVPTLGQAYDLWFMPDMRRRLDEYLRDPRPGKRGELMKPGTFRQAESTWRNHVGPALSGVPVGDIRYSDVQDLLDVNVNLSFAIFTNVNTPIAPMSPHRPRQRQAPFPAPRSGARSLVR